MKCIKNKCPYFKEYKEMNYCNFIRTKIDSGECLLSPLRSVLKFIEDNQEELEIVKTPSSIEEAIDCDT